MNMDTTKMTRWLALLSLCTSACSTTVNLACHTYRRPEWRDNCMECSGTEVKAVPRLLNRTLKVLLMTRTAITSVDNTTFERSQLPALEILYLTLGALTSVGAHAFCSLPALIKLYLDNNRLEILNELSFSCNQNLTTVSLKNNRSLFKLPRLISPSVQTLNLENCSLASIDVATVEDMTALKVLSLTGNRGIQCDFVKAQFKQARPDLRVICEDSAGDTLSSVFPSDEERTSEKSLYEPNSTINNTKSIIDDEKTTSQKSFTESDFTIKNTKNITGDEKHTSEKSLTESDSAIGSTIKDKTDDIERNESDDMKNKEKDTNANTSSGIFRTVVIVIPIIIIIIIIIICVCCWCRNSVQKSQSDDPTEQPLNEIS
ncbi:uncharacterized protein LOC126282006 [Schistocerca gregaria]|uniref:uncharacterized protein LOC126282006 n=1 Tax=Schistocerca gregaria TaxID=7010 RepID=UPI00211EBDB5|nr:uncharacterized protein LOC126282006 [Schistocerca gregaria]